MPYETTQRLKNLVAFLRQRYPNGATTSEIADELGVTRQTALKDIQRLEEQGIPLIQDGWEYVLAPGFEHDLRLTTAQAWMLYLPLRKMVRAQLHRLPLVRSLLRQVTALLRDEMAEPLEGEETPVEAVPDLIFQDLARCWAEHTLAEIEYRPLRTASPTRMVIAPWWFEPSVWSDAYYVICGRLQPNGSFERYTLKLDRIRKVTRLEHKFDPPEPAEITRQVEQAWGIWGSDGEATMVRLRFHPRHLQRLQETHWHPTEKIHVDEDGHVLWEAQVAEPQEMLPWVRGWGADVEVLEPASLRRALVREAQRLAQLYGGTDTPRLLRCWGKTPRSQKGVDVDPEDFHPALYHMIDAGHVAAQLLGGAASPRWHTVLANALGADPDRLVEWLPLLVSVHDMGKISAEFQGQVATQRSRLAQEGFAFGPSSDLHHSVISQVWAMAEAADNLPKPLRLLLRDSLGGHHGRFVSPKAWQRARSLLGRDEPEPWPGLRHEAFEALQKVFGKTMPAAEAVQIANRSTAVMALTGFTILCDWLASDERFFQCRPELSLEAYLALSREQAAKAVAEAGFIGLVASAAPVDFAALFHHLPGIRPLQAAMDHIPAETLAKPCLAIIEAPTGEGKTEAALALAHRLGQARGSEEFYYALPTTATSNQMFRRVQRYLTGPLGLAARARLVHSQAYLLEDDLGHEPLENGREGGHDSEDWFGPKKRALLAPFGVGTVDQAELCALNTLHNALRFIGLAGKTLIIDEVHAYDTYMTTILARLLRWLSALGASVILLSATLPLARREQLIRAYTGKEPGAESQDQLAYPSLLVASEAGVYRASPPAAQPERTVHLDSLSLTEDNAEHKAAWLLEQIREGGSACWITNTVDRAQRMFAALDALAGSEVHRLLLHSRFPLADRQRLEESLVGLYGVDGQRPAKGVVIGTQVLEQSLDLDFDVMVSDLAPIDLLLQRAGRLHRHPRPRPENHAVPRLYLYIRHNALGALDLSGDSAIYDEYILRKTFETLEGRTEIRLPEQYRPLIEAVYAARQNENGPLAEAFAALKKKMYSDSEQAEQRLIPEPDPEEPFCAAVTDLVFDEDEDRAGWMVAQTRLGEESITVIPLERSGDRATCEGLPRPVDLSTTAPRPVQLALLRRSLRISHPDVVAALKLEEASRPAIFKKSALLRRVMPLWLENGQAILLAGPRRYELKLDPKLGLLIRKETKP